MMQGQFFSKYKYHLLLHLVVFVWGWTGILGKLISIHALPLVWIRIGMTLLLIALYMAKVKPTTHIPLKSKLQLMLVGTLIALHWIFFYYTIQISNVSIAVICLSTSTFFNAILNPLFFKVRTKPYEFLIGIIVVLAIAYIFNYQPGFEYAITLGIVSAFFSAAFTTINGKLSPRFETSLFSFYELLGGFFFLTPLLFIDEQFMHSVYTSSSSDWIWLFILASVCTAFPFFATAVVLKYIKSFTVILAINLEPVYTILFAWLLFGDAEKMNLQFYIGTLLILLTLVLNGIIKAKIREE
jgi:drug/metabolite transporter (DMT)-like permease